LVEVDPSLANAIQINYEIMPGVRHEIAAVRISGNRYFTEDEIRNHLKTRQSGVLNHGVYSDDILSEDRRTIEAMYRNAGFEGTVVTTKAEDVDHTIVVTIEIQEGKLVPIDFITITGNSALTEKQLRAALAFKEGDIFTPGKVDQGRAALTQLYY